MSSSRKIRVVCISDTHGHAPGEGYVLPKGDVLIHAGDLTNQGSLNEIRKAAKWLGEADFAAKIVVGGNHDLSLDPEYTLKHDSGWRVVPTEAEECRQLMNDTNVVYLQHAHATVHVPGKDVALRVFGSPYSSDRGKQNWAFQYFDGEAEATWKDIEANLDILITHTPPAGICDTSKHWQEGGCSALMKRLGQVRPSLHVNGHCHEGRGAAIIDWESNERTAWVDSSQGSKKLSRLDLTKLVPNSETAVVNASIMATSHGRGGKSFNKAMVVDLLVTDRLEKNNEMTD
ncbi:putative calcineurin-like phosphoesterase domain, ApaH type, metallo-dependent phosphatase [Septoria linicola]|nr:putative calcineurin-like phosphoesterase domain, ApaH type, metallo-dependent phosphatase [Septoria linicola]